MTKIKKTSQLSAEILAPLIKYCAENRGSLTKITERFNKGLSEKIRLTTIQRWLCKDDAKRVEPASGPMLRLLEVWREIRGVDVVNVKEQSIFCAANGCTPAHDGLSCKRCGKSL